MERRVTEVPRKYTIAPPKDFDPRLYAILKRLNSIAEETQNAIGDVNRGELPNSSGTPIVPSGNFFLLPGRPFGQIGYGATEAGGSLTLGSTANITKGKIYLGSQGAYDESLGRLGLGTQSPLAILDVRDILASSFQYARPNTATPGVWTDESDLNVNIQNSINEVTPEDVRYVHGLTPVSGTQGPSFLLPYLTNPNTTVNHVLSYRFRRTVGTAGTVDVHIRLLCNAVLVASWDHIAISNTTFTTVSQTLTAGQVATIVANGYANLTFEISDGGGGGGADRRLEVSWAEFKVPQTAASDLTRWYDVNSALVAFIVSTGALTINGLTVRDPTTPTQLILFNLSTAFAGTNQLKFTSSAARIWTLPDATGTVALLELAQTWLGTQTFKDANFNLVDDADITKKLVLQLSGIATGNTRTLTVPDVSGTLALWDSPVNLLAQTTSLGPTTLKNTTKAGLYRVVVSGSCSAAGASGTLQVTITWTQGGVVKTKTVFTTALSLTSTANADGGEAIVFADVSTNIQYTSTLAGGAGSPAYDLHIRLEYVDV